MKSTSIYQYIPTGDDEYQCAWVLKTLYSYDNDLISRIDFKIKSIRIKKNSRKLINTQTAPTYG